MGVNVSHSQRVKYVQAKEYEGVDGGQGNFDEREQFLGESSRVGGFDENIYEMENVFQKVTKLDFFIN